MLPNLCWILIILVAKAYVFNWIIIFPKLLLYTPHFYCTYFVFKKMWTSLPVCDKRKSNVSRVFNTRASKTTLTSSLVRARGPMSTGCTHIGVPLHIGGLLRAPNTMEMYFLTLTEQSRSLFTRAAQTHVFLGSSL